jgi:hypothetical protein
MDPAFLTAGPETVDELPKLGATAGPVRSGCGGSQRIGPCAGGGGSRSRRRGVPGLLLGDEIAVAVFEDGDGLVVGAVVGADDQRPAVAVLAHQILLVCGIGIHVHLVGAILLHHRQIREHQVVPYLQLQRLRRLVDNLRGGHDSPLVELLKIPVTWFIR